MPSMLLGPPLAEEGIFVLEIVPEGGAAVANHVSIFKSQVQFIHFHTFKWGLLVRGLTGISESGFGCAIDSNSLSLVKNVHLALTSLAHQLERQPADQRVLGSVPARGMYQKKKMSTLVWHASTSLSLFTEG
uniref:Uncharacterized protein n=1 Tax=Molossus molossus TaxID=27622 RepID=A0A7J8I8C6_MOLMO|nr:hypothetical protein HJG59_010700 [Molossus molossus]